MTHVRDTRFRSRFWRSAALPRASQESEAPSDIMSDPAPKRAPGLIAMARKRASASRSEAPSVMSGVSVAANGRFMAVVPQNSEAGSFNDEVKRRRTSSAASSRQPGGDPSSSSGALEEQHIERGKTCLACRRSIMFDCSYLTQLQNFVWQYPDGRGQICRDCSNLYRIQMKSCMTLGLFERWVKDEPNMVAWSRSLAAYLSLKREGAQHVGLPQLQAREQTLAYVFNLFAIPFGHFRIERDDAAFLGALANDNAGNLSMAKTRDGGVVGLRLCAPSVHTDPSSSKASSNRFVTMAQAARAWPLDPWHTFPQSLVEDWHSAVGDKAFSTMNVDGMPSGPADAIALDDPEPVPPHIEPPQTLQQKSQVAKIAVLEDSTKLLIISLVSDGGVSAGPMEKEFSPLLAKVLRLKQDFLQCSAPPEMVPRLAKLASLVAATKRVIHPLRHYAKNGKRSHLEGIDQSLMQVYEYAIANSIDPSGDFVGTMVKAAFFRMFPQNAVDAIDYLTKFDYPINMCNLPADRASSAAMTIHACVSSMLLCSLQAPLDSNIAEAQWATEKSRMLDLGRMLHDKLAELITKIPPLDPFLAILKVFLGSPMRSGGQGGQGAPPLAQKPKVAPRSYSSASTPPLDAFG